MWYKNGDDFANCVISICVLKTLNQMLFTNSNLIAAIVTVSAVGVYGAPSVPVAKPAGGSSYGDKPEIPNQGHRVYGQTVY